ncbi:MAG: 3-deoxy-7-phosphoheptulonate synthase [Planctomycetaceae bacterium]|nr:3-deoxy-7-phosphoheptulonate synthase [Planctomycetaceae bacterium]
MIVRLFSTVTSAELERVTETIMSFPFPYFQTTFNNQPYIVICSQNQELKAALQNLIGVENVVPISNTVQKYPLASREFKENSTQIQASSLTVGNGAFTFIAGPCSVESESQLLKIAHEVRKMGATGLRGGAFKPRTNPYDFQGLKETGLKLLAKAREETGLAVVTEVMAPEEVPLVCQYADVLQIGTRNMQNYRLLEAAGRARKPVLLKRGFSATLEEFLMAAEYILLGGNSQVILCERGIRTFETYTRFTLALAAVPALREMTHLPVIVDPSHAAGKASYVTPLAAAATAVGADGLLVEIHHDPDHALCDGRQSLVFEEFERMVKICREIHDVITPHPHLEIRPPHVISRNISEQHFHN